MPEQKKIHVLNVTSHPTCKFASYFSYLTFNAFQKYIKNHNVFHKMKVFTLYCLCRVEMLPVLTIPNRLLENFMMFRLRSQLSMKAVSNKGAR